jgi:hypothetical protein
MPLETIVPDAMWASERPVWFGGVRLRARTTVIQLDDGSLWVHSPTPPTDAWCEAVDAIGPVRWLVVPNCFHHLGTPEAAARYPDATVVGPTSAVEHNEKLQLGMSIDDRELADRIPELERIPLEGVPFLDESVFFHRPTGTLIGTDLLITACARDHWSWRWAGSLTGCFGKVVPPPDVKPKADRSGVAAASIDAMAALPIERIVVAHADPIVDDPIGHLQAAWAFAHP